MRVVGGESGSEKNDFCFSSRCFQRNQYKGSFSLLFSGGVRCEGEDAQCEKGGIDGKWKVVPNVAGDSIGTRRGRGVGPSSSQRGRLPRALGKKIRRATKNLCQKEGSLKTDVLGKSFSAEEEPQLRGDLRAKSAEGRAGCQIRPVTKVVEKRKSKKRTTTTARLEGKGDP